MSHFVLGCVHEGHHWCLCYQYSGGSRIDEREFQWRRRILAMVVLTRENGAVACPLGKFWVSDLLISFLVQSGSIRESYSFGIHLNMDG